MRTFFLKTFKHAGITLVFTSLFSMLMGNCSNKVRTPFPWSVRMADSEMQRNPEPWMIDFRESPKWEYTQGLVLKAILQVWQATGDEKYYRYVNTYYDQFIDSAGQISTYNLEEYNIDRINPGKVLFTLYQKAGAEKYKKALYLLRKQMATHPRTSEGGFWHKNIYPHQMWLDGLYMAAPFLAQFAVTFNEPALLDEVAQQFILMERHARDETTGLLYHGWDESRQQRWADPTSGRSPHVWGRALGWFAMALVDVLDYFPADHPKRAEIIAMLQRLADAVVRFQDAETGLWYQVIDCSGQPGNYLESSAACMLVYTLTKAVKQGYIDPKFSAAAQKGYAGILKHFIETDKNGWVQIHQVCTVAGLGGTPYRDGTYEYYIHEKIGSNDPKAVGPFILASLELESFSK